MDLKNLTFRGGVHPDGNKDLSNQAPITRAKEPALVSISMHQHTGAPCEPTVQVGDTVDINQVVCIVEAMKIMNEVVSKVPAIVERILVRNGEPVEYGQPLIALRPLA